MPLQEAERRLKISTHALTWRATKTWYTNNKDVANFYPRPHMEGDRSRPESSGTGQNFYPRPHMEGDIRSLGLYASVHQFLPTPSHGGRRESVLKYLWLVMISTHALTWRATFPVSCMRHVCG